MEMKTTDIVYITLEGIIGIATTIGNAMVLWAIYKNSRLQTVTNYFIASLALADLLVGLLVAPLAILSFQGMPRNFYGCVFINSTLILLTQCSINGLLVIAIERFVAIKSPFVYVKYFTSAKALFIISFGWVIAILIGLVPMFGWNLSAPEKDLCKFIEVIDMRYMVYFVFFGCIILPLLIMFVIYAYIFHIVHKQLKQIAMLEAINRPQRKIGRRKFLKEIRAVKSLAMVIALFAACWFPIHISNTLSLLQGYSFPPDILLVSILLSHANSAINPFLYAYGNREFQLTFKSLCCKHQSDATFTDRASDNYAHRHSHELPSISGQIDK